ncbi:MAG: alpha/beta hydrolase [Actinomycetota bacterium]
MRLGVAAALTVGAVAVIIGGIWVLQDHFIYFPGPDPGAPPDAWVEFSVETDDGLLLNAWTRSNEANNHQPVVIVFPGNAGSRAGRVLLGDRLVDAGYTVVLSDYRGYGGNPGRPSEAGIAADARAIAHAVRERGMGSGTIIYYGESLGAAVAVSLATEEPPDVLVLGSPFTSMADVGRHHYPFLPVGTLLRDEYASLERIEAGDLVGVPAFVIAGTGDRTIPVEQSRRIAGALGAEIHEVSGADHNDPSIRSSSEMVAHVSAFVDRVLRDGVESDE